LSFENLKREQTVLLEWVQQHSVLSVAAFIAFYILVTAASIPGGAVLTMAGGSVFGALATTIYVNIGATTGAVLAFLAARYLLGSWIQAKYGAQLLSFNREMDRNGARYLLGLRLLPVFPFFLINLLAGLTRVPVGTFLWTTAVGIIPGTAVYAFAGQELAAIGSPAEILSLRLAVAFGILALAAVLPALLDRIRAVKRHSK
jgi:uncharacterized membrane protein YdjX (TVP38/TMEM64 family)